MAFTRFVDSNRFINQSIIFASQIIQTTLNQLAINLSRKQKMKKQHTQAIG